MPELNQYNLEDSQKTNDFQLKTPEFVDVFDTLGGNTLVKKGNLQSPNYVPTIQGYTLNNDGSAEFQDALINGRIITTDITIGGRVISVSAAADIQPAIDLISAAGGGEVRVSPGVYVLTSDIVIPSSVTVSGTDDSNTIFVFAGAFQVKIVGVGSYSTGTLSATANSTTLTGSGTAWLANVAVGDRVRIGGVWYQVVAVNSDTNITLAIPFGGVSASGLSYLAATTVNDAGISKITITGSTLAGLKIQYATFFVVEDLTIYGNGGGGVDLDDAGQGFITNVICLGNTGDGFNLSNINLIPGDNMLAFSNSANGITITGSNSTESSFRDLACVGNGAIGLNITGGTDIVFDALAARNNGTQGVYVDGVTDLVLMPTRIRDNGSDGIRIATNVDDAKIVANRIKDNGGWGINITGSTSDNTTITSCVITGNSSGSISDSGTGTIIRGNIGADDNFTSAPSSNVVSAKPAGFASTVSTATLGTNTQARIMGVDIPYNIKANKVSFSVNAVGTSGTIDVGLYTEDGQTKLFDVTTATISGAGIVTTSLASETNIAAGFYYLAMVPNSTTSITLDTADIATIDPVGEVLLSGLLTVSAGTLPTTFDPTTLTANSKVAYVRLDN